ncbi:MAG: 50S ribosomal protein L31 [Pseudomonadota bacterium]
MKDKIHPKYPEASIKCACGNTIETKSTKGSFSIEICSNCHPFYTGQEKIMDSAGRIEQFNRKYSKNKAK